ESRREIQRLADRRAHGRLSAGRTKVARPCKAWRFPPTRSVEATRALAEAHRGASATQERHGGPAVAGDDRAVRTEVIAERLELLRGRRRVDVPGECIALTDAEVVDRPDVEAPQLKHQVHLGRPAPDPAHGGQPLDQLLVASSRRAAE